MAKEPKKPRRVSDQEVRETILALCREEGVEGKIKPETVAMDILPQHWRTLLKRIRIMSRHLAHEGKIVILRKGEPADPDDFKGLYRLRITAEGLKEEAEKQETGAEEE
jgi:hypothetical protein